jgi:hypothetical protein
MSLVLVKTLSEFTNPQDEKQLQVLDQAIQAINPEFCCDAEFNALLDIFERFPEPDGLGVFWGVVHALEACNGYEPSLMASVNRKPCEFNVLMINRLLNAGVTEIDGQSLIEVLQKVPSNPTATVKAGIDAHRYLQKHSAVCAPN